MAYTEFYCQTTADNLNAGSTTGDAAVYTSAAGDSDGTSVFTPNDGSTPASSVNVGDFGSVYVTAGATVAVFVGRVTAVAAGVNGAITFSTTAKSGTFPASSAGAHTITCKVGGAWKGPNAAVSFPYGFIAATQTNVAGDPYCVNVKGGTNYAVTAAMTHGVAGPGRFEGYTTTAHDGGRATTDGAGSAAGITMLTVSGSGNDIELVNLIFQNNGPTNNINGVLISSSRCYLQGCVFSGMRAAGISVTGSGVTLKECEAYGNNLSASAAVAGIQCSNADTLIRCISHDNTGVNSSGFLLSSNVNAIDCVADTNGAHGFNVTSTGYANLIGCDAYNNTGDGIRLNNSTSGNHLLENCNLVKNGGWGVNGAGAGSRVGSVFNCGFGSGTQVNTSGTTTGLSAMQEVGSITYAANVTPWVDPANGDFRINLAAAKNAGRGAFTQTAASYAGTVAYPDVGASQHLDASSVAYLGGPNVMVL